MTKTEKPPLHRTLHDCDRELSRQRPNHSQAPDGEIWSCPCGRCFEHVCDEAEGCRWDLVTRSDATPSFPAASPAPEDQDRELQPGSMPVKQVQNLTMDVSLLDKIEGPVKAEHLPRALPRAVNRMENTVIQMLESVPKFEGDERFAGQLGGEMACLRDAAREVCRQAGTHWPSERDKERLIRFFFESRASETGKRPPP